MLKRRRTIVLYEKVRAPRQRVRNNERHGSEPPAAFDHRSAQQHPAQNRANAVDHSRACLAVRSHVRRPEFGKRHGRPLALRSCAELITSPFDHCQNQIAREARSRNRTFLSCAARTLGARFLAQNLVRRAAAPDTKTKGAFRSPETPLRHASLSGVGYTSFRRTVFSARVIVRGLLEKTGSDC